MLFKIVLNNTNDADLAASFAIFAAKQHGADEVTPDHILLGCLRVISRFGIATLGPWSLDLEALGVDWVRQPDGPRVKPRRLAEHRLLTPRGTDVHRVAEQL